MTYMTTKHIAVVGMFDGVHIGHQYLLQHLRTLAAETSLRPLVITFSNHPLEIVNPQKAPLLLSTSEEKLLLLANRDIEVEMLPFDGMLRQTSTEEFLHLLKNKYNVGRVLVGFNNRFGHNAPSSFEEFSRMASDCGIELIRDTELTTADHPQISSSTIRRMLTEGNIDGANALLGRAYSVEGVVAHGQAIGRTIGFPTANVVPDFKRKLIPTKGVYAAEAILSSGERFPAMVNIGSRPTINHKGAPATIEAHLIGYNDDLYARRLTLNFHHFMRPEQKFSSLQALQAQLDTDRANALTLLKV